MIGSKFCASNQVLVTSYSNFWSFSPLSPQDAIDLFLGNYVVDRWEGVESPSPLHIDRTWRFKLVRGVAQNIIELYIIFARLIRYQISHEWHVGIHYLVIWVWPFDSSLYSSFFFGGGNVEYIDIIEVQSLLKTFANCRHKSYVQELRCFSLSTKATAHFTIAYILC